MLPNVKIVGDHFHFAQAIVNEGFDKIRIKVREDMKKSYGAKMLRHYLKLERQMQLPKHIPKNIRKEVDNAVNTKAKEFDSKKFLLFARYESLASKPDKLVIVNELLREYPLRASMESERSWPSDLPCTAGFGPDQKSQRSRVEREGQAPPNC